MGRKPNQLILEFFERGPKLEDSSNRYQHTCRACGEKFPKGRIDGLTGHLLKKCPGIGFPERQRIVQQLSETPNQHGSFNQLAVAMRHAQNGSQLENQPFVANSNMSALETLAEVSRQQLDSSGQYVPAPENLRKRRRSSGLGEGITQQYSASNFLDDDHQNQQHGPQDSEDDARRIHNAIQLLPGMNYFASAEQVPATDPDLVGARPLSSGAPVARMMPAQLALAASAANDMMPGAGAAEITFEGTNFNIPNKLLPGSDRRMSASITMVQTIDPQLRDDTTGTHPDAHGASPMPAGPNSPLLMINSHLPHAAYLNDFSIAPNGVPRPKVRGRFSASRRKEVQEVRKQGACVRCRMLKKPCSGGTPCATCRNVESARLWKQPCVRTRIADEFDLYSAQLHTVLVFHEISQIKAQYLFEPSAPRIEATHFPESQIPPAVFSASRGHPSSNPSAGPHSVPLNDVQAGEDLELLDQDADDIGSKLDLYIKRISRAFFENESSPVMRPTLLLAMDLTHQKLDPLLSRALDLWTATEMLVDPAAAWHFFSTTSSTANVPSAPSQRSAITGVDTVFNHRILTMQLRGHVEKRAGQLAKTLMNDLERRLLQRQQASGQHFETFLIAIILLNCVERVCWDFSTWSRGIGRAGDAQNPNERGVWPLERSPEEFVSKGERIADVVAMLLRMRGVPPVMTVSEQGILRTDMPKAEAAHAMGPISLRTSLATEEGKTNIIESGATTIMDVDHNATAATWFEIVGLNVDALRVAQAAVGTWDAVNCRCWDMRFVSRLLLDG